MNDFAPKPASNLKRVNGVDGIRGVGSMFVVFAHVMVFTRAADFTGSQWLGGVFVIVAQGLTMFFIISGYLLYRPFVDHVVADRGQPMIGAFYRNRLWRIFPAWIVVFVLVALVLGAALVEPSSLDNPVPIQDRLGRMTDPTDILLNLTLLYAYFPGTTNGMMVSWSLVVEVAFYAVLPLLYLIGRGIAGRSPSRARAIVAMTIPALVLLAIGTFGRLRGATDQLKGVMQGGGSHDAQDRWAAILHNSLYDTGDLCAYGMLVAVMVSALRGSERFTRVMPNICWATLIVSVPIAVALHSRHFDMPFWGLACAAIFLLVVIPGDGLPQRGLMGLLKLRVIDHLGVISYSTYLWHVPVIALLLKYWPGLAFSNLLGLAFAFFVVLAVSIPLAELTYRYAEKVGLDRKVIWVKKNADKPVA